MNSWRQFVMPASDVLLLDVGRCLRDQAMEVCSGARARELEFRATSLATLAQIVAAGLGVTLLPRLSVATAVEHAQLAIRRFDEPAPARTLILAWRTSSPLAPGFQQVAATLREAYPTERQSRPVRPMRPVSLSPFARGDVERGRPDALFDLTEVLNGPVAGLSVSRHP